MAGEREQNRDLTLAPDTFLCQQNIGKGGVITVYRGPCVVNQTGQDQPVVFDKDKGYRSCHTLEQAVQICKRANEGDYVVLENPAEDNTFPRETSNQAKSLQKGRKVIIPGPWCEALWPGQVATVIEGHRLRSNQYLVAIVYNAEEAERNWDKITVAKSGLEEGSTASSDPANQKTQTNPQTKSQGLTKPDSFAVGTRIVIRGEDVSFFLPCTGLEVLRDKDNNFVREAVTLEQLEYCCLIDEGGKKTYPRGPKVVFPKPTEVFEEDSKRRRKFRPIELNTINGLHLKVTADFEGPDIENDINKSRKFKEGEELFVTGRTLSIYYPREELAIIEYGQGIKKHYSTAVPKGEGRYVIDRQTGEIRLIRGPNMFLADPRRDIPVRRILSVEDCKLWYPGNEDAIAYNLELAQAMATSPSGRSGAVSEGDWRKLQARRRGGAVACSSSYLAEMPMAATEAFSLADYTPEEVGDEGGAGESIYRGNVNVRQQSKTLTLNTKFDGVPKIEVWPGYAVMVVGSEGSRRVVEGPEVILLEYDEKLGAMELSTGTPKSDARLARTSYLCVQNNKVGDLVSFESRDHVKGVIQISLRVNFEAASDEDKLKWFGVDNYIKFLTDHVRSLIAGMAKRFSIAEIKANYINLVRDSILGEKPTTDEKRRGLFFSSNGMRVVDVDVLDIRLNNQTIADLLEEAEQEVVESNIELEQAQRQLANTKSLELIAQEQETAKYETEKLKLDLKKQIIQDQIDLLLAEVEQQLGQIDGERQKTEARDAITDFVRNAELERAKLEANHRLVVDTATQKLKLEELDAATAAAVKRFEAGRDGLYEILTLLHRDDMAAKLAQGCTIERYLSGDDTASSIANLFSISPILKQFFEKADGMAKDLPTNGRNRLAKAESPATVR